MPKTNQQISNTDNNEGGEQEEFQAQNFQDYDEDDDSNPGQDQENTASSQGSGNGKSQSRPAKRAGRRKISIEFIKDKSRRHITFSKRKAGIMKKAYELSTLTGTQVLLLVASETGHVYTFATPKLQPLITKTEGKNLIQACLNSPDPTPEQQSQQQQQGTLGGEEVPPATAYHQQQHHQHEPAEDERKAKKIKTELKTTQYQPAAHYATHHQQAPTQHSQLPMNYDLPTASHQTPPVGQYSPASSGTPYPQHSLPPQQGAGNLFHAQHLQMGMQGGAAMNRLPNYGQMGGPQYPHTQQHQINALYQMQQGAGNPMSQPQTPQGHQKLTISAPSPAIPPQHYVQSQQQTQQYQIPLQHNTAGSSQQAGLDYSQQAKN